MKNTKKGCVSCDSCPVRSSSELLDYCAECTDEKTEKEAFQKKLDAYRDSWERRYQTFSPD